MAPGHERAGINRAARRLVLVTFVTTRTIARPRCIPAPPDDENTPHVAQTHATFLMVAQTPTAPRPRYSR
jgi:hypothetical protein